MFSCIITMISNFKIFIIFQIFIFQLIFTNKSNFWIFIWFLLLFFVKNFILVLFEINYFHCVLFKNSQNFFIQFLPLYISCSFSMLLKEDILHIQKLDRICSLIFDVDEFSGLFLHPSIFSIIFSKSV